MTPSRPTSAVSSYLDRPLSAGWCVAGWLVATALFVGLAAATGGPGTIDSSESMYSTWAIAHGQLACAYPSVTLPHEPTIAPVYPLYSGALAALFHVGQSLPFPPRAVGPHCAAAISAMRPWAFHSGAYLPTRWIGFTSWLVLMAGVVAWLRAAGKGRCGWEPVTLLALACLPPIWIAVSFYFHPQDLVALGLALAAMACAVRARWLAAGGFLGLAVLSQQFALLVAAPLFVLAPRDQGGRPRLAAGALVAAAVVTAPFLLTGAPGVLRGVALGSGNTITVGGTMAWHLTHHGATVVLVSRIIPVVAAMALSAWTARRLGSSALTPPAVASLVAACVSLRLVFEQSLIAYYFLALVVTLVLADVVRGHIRGSLVAWIAAMLLVFFLDGYFLEVDRRILGEDILPPLVILFTLGLIVWSVTRGRSWSPWSLLLWCGVAACAAITWRAKVNPFDTALPFPVWQVVFVWTGLLLAVGPLLDAIRNRPANVPLVAPSGRPDDPARTATS